MFDYARRMKLALSDTARRTAIKAGGGAVLAVGAIFLLAALWSFLARDLGWGPTLAHLAVGAVAILLGVVAFVIAGKPKHVAPTTDDLKREVEARLTLAKEAAIIRARSEATRFVDMAENKVHSLIDTASHKALGVVNDAERTAVGFARSTARTVGLTAENLNAAREGYEAARDGLQATKEQVQKASNSNAGSMAKVIGAFAMGVTLASKVQEWRQGSYDDDYAMDDDLAYEDHYRNDRRRYS